MENKWCYSITLCVCVCINIYKVILRCGRPFFFFFNADTLLNRVIFECTIKSCSLIALKFESIKLQGLKICLHEKNEGICTREGLYIKYYLWILYTPKYYTFIILKF